MVVQKEEEMSMYALSTFMAKEDERVLTQLGRVEEETRLATIRETQSEIRNGAETSASRKLVAYDLHDPQNYIPLRGPLDKSTPQTYAEKVVNILGAKKSRNYNKDPPCKRKLCYSYLGDGEHDEPIDVEHRSTASIVVPVVLLLSRIKHKKSNNL